MLTNKSEFKLKKPFKGPYEIVPTWKNCTVNLCMGAVTSRTKILRIKPYHKVNA